MPEDRRRMTAPATENKEVYDEDPVYPDTAFDITNPWAKCLALPACGDVACRDAATPLWTPNTSVVKLIILNYPERTPLVPKQNPATLLAPLAPPGLHGRPILPVLHPGHRVPLITARGGQRTRALRVAYRHGIEHFGRFTNDSSDQAHFLWYVPRAEVTPRPNHPRQWIVRPT